MFCSCFNKKRIYAKEELSTTTTITNHNSFPILDSLPILACIMDKNLNVITTTNAFASKFRDTVLSDILQKEELEDEMNYKIEFKQCIIYQLKRYTITFTPFEHQPIWFVYVDENWNPLSDKIKNISSCVSEASSAESPSNFQTSSNPNLMSNSILSPTSSPTRKELIFNVNDDLIICNWTRNLSKLFEIPMTTTNEDTHVGQLVGQPVNELNVNLHSLIYNMIEYDEHANKMFIKTTNNYILCLIKRKSLFYTVTCINIRNIILEALQENKNNNLVKLQKFISYVFHEVRNPLNIISLGINHLNIELETQQKLIANYNNISTTIEDILNSTNNIRNILNEVLTINKIQENQFVIDKKPFIFGNLVTKCERLLHYQMTEKKIEFLVANNIGSLCINGDEAKLEQVISNLLSNAIKFTKIGGKIELSTHITILNNNKYIHVSVRDNGVGIEENNKDKIFIPYQQIRSGELQNGGGTGLGLVISKTIVEKHGGIMNFESELGQGSTFYFNIPLEICSKRRLSKHYNKSMMHICDEMNKHKILLADDNPTICKLSVYMFKNLGILSDKITVCNDGLECFKEYKKSLEHNDPYTLIFMDKEMPTMDGYEATKQIMELDGDAIIVGLTGNSLTEQIEEYIECGVKDVITKPIDKKILCDILKKYMRNNNNNNTFNATMTSDFIEDTEPSSTDQTPKTQLQV